MKKLLSLLLALVMLLSFAACANDDTPPADGDDQQQEEQNGSEAGTMNKLADIKAAGELVVGTSADYPPYEFHTEIDGKDTIVGFDIAIAQAFADELGVELKLVDMAFESLLISLQNGDFDLVMAGLTPDEERAKTVDFTDVFFHNKQIVIIRAEDADKYVTTEDMAGTTLGVQAGTIQETIAADLTDENKVVKLKKFPELIMELKTGKIDGVCTNTMVASAYVSAHPDLLCQDIGIVWDNTGFAGAIQKGDNGEFMAFLNETIAKLQEDGSIDRFVAEAQQLANASSEDADSEAA
ncbi:MAG TPA: transporter substrate-binding domain-containing protein [Candidatus Galloscillospira excrementipullorum]|nr:transporter substrate-binding domain-containing protein [Candidatus Galloscillospira excrementipullorum]